MKEKNNIKGSAIWMCVTAMFMALTILTCSFSIPVPGGHLYLVDVIICTASIILDPIAAFMVGGIGSFLGDLIFYPTPMFVSLVSHGMQAVIISVFSHHIMKKKPVLSSGIGVALGSVVMVTGYMLGKIFVYGDSNIEVALVVAMNKLPFEILQAVVGAVMGMIISWKLGIKAMYKKLVSVKRR